ncbi:C40 family peptidase [Sulfurovum sp.]|uniref:C40 family peptidase n=1 Tax=Sulfurovum sp. TaxID=1969726 RepID=UPI0025F79539|nr:C40 family peptidase [Sulfurovum sp.]
MLKQLLIFTTLLSFIYSNIFTITDKKGKVFHSENIQHTENEYLNQKATEYSLQAIYDELHRAENLARMAEAARQRAKRIAKAKAAAKKAGKTYHLSEADRKQLLQDAKVFKGGKYVWGGTTPQGFDCSGYVQYLYNKHNIHLPRTAWAQSQKGVLVDKHNLQKGDLLFFLTDKKRGIPVTHVGIYIGGGKFIHAASKKKGIIISPIDHGYYSNKFVSARRVTRKT